MGKKKNKFKRHSSSPQSPIMANTSTIVTPTNNTIISVETPVVATAQIDEISLLNQKYQYVRRDTLKLGIVLLSLAILFIAIFFFNEKTTYLQTFGDWIYKIGNFQIL